MWRHRPEYVVKGLDGFFTVVSSKCRSNVQLSDRWICAKTKVQFLDFFRGQPRNNLLISLGRMLPRIISKDCQSCMFGHTRSHICLYESNNKARNGHMIGQSSYTH